MKDIECTMLSKKISEVCKMFDDAIKEYQWNSDKVTETEELTQDYLHKLELGNLKYEERAKVATQLANCRRERRIYKDAVQNLEPLVSFLCTDKGKQLLKQLREVLGQTRKSEGRMKNRVYIPRVLRDGDIEQ